MHDGAAAVAAPGWLQVEHKLAQVVQQLHAKMKDDAPLASSSGPVATEAACHGHAGNPAGAVSVGGCGQLSTVAAWEQPLRAIIRMAQSIDAGSHEAAPDIYQLDSDDDGDLVGCGGEGSDESLAALESDGCEMDSVSDGEFPYLGGYRSGSEVEEVEAVMSE